MQKIVCLDKLIYNRRLQLYLLDLLESLPRAAPSLFTSPCVFSGVSDPSPSVSIAMGGVGGKGCEDIK